MLTILIVALSLAVSATVTTLQTPVAGTTTATVSAPASDEFVGSGPPG
jgi:hypothetical protein